MRRIILLIIPVLIIACSTREKLPVQTTNNVYADTITETSVKIQPMYQKTPAKLWQLIHTKLSISFDFKNEAVIGMATLRLKPYFYSTQKLELDAKSFVINSINLISGLDTLNNIDFGYDKRKISIQFSKEYSRNDSIELIIDYVAHPNEVQDEGGKAISGAQGLYFINAQGNNENMPTQIWTQGETDFSSCWFPTLDEPNQKTTQEFEITVPEEYKTLSNGILEFSTENGNGTRTDYWTQNKSHSPYLAMLAIGDFAVIKDTWRNKEVSYFVEPAFEADAPYIFENTKEMLEFYSNKLGVDYPWDKYSQVVVRNFVSGAMENTSATLHGEFVQRHKRELIDYNPEGVIAHELFHQWFGDLVSCESWANLPLNEAFATYGEFLWKEYKYGDDEANYHLMNNLNSYLRESKFKREEWVRFNYKSKDDMFDGHTYSKGARILHMLRIVSGDSAFFKVLNTYLTRYAYGSAEMHQLRLIFEEITGLDYNWFFDQWAYKSGHPELRISHTYDSISKNLHLSVHQIHDLENHPLFQIPFSVEVYVNGKKRRYELWIQDEINDYNIVLEGKPSLVDFDSEKYILCEKKEIKPESEWIFQYNNCNTFLARYEAIKAIASSDKISSKGREVLYNSLSDAHYSIRLLALSNTGEIDKIGSSELEEKLSTMQKKDSNSKVRAKALEILVKEYHPNESRPLIENALSDSSYLVVATGLRISSEKDSVASLVYASQLESLKNKELQFEIANIYSNYGNKDKANFFINLEKKIGDYSKVRLIFSYKNFILRIQDDQVSTLGIKNLGRICRESQFVWVKRSAVDALVEIEDLYQMEKAKLEEEKLNQEGNGKAQIALRKRLEKVSFMLDYIDTTFKNIEKTEKDQEILDAIYKDDTK